MNPNYSLGNRDKPLAMSVLKSSTLCSHSLCNPLKSVESDKWGYLTILKFLHQVFVKNAEVKHLMALL